jgi:FixJ family two-component response regulator
MNPSLSNAHVIIVDDESINLTIMEISLKERDCKVSCFQSAEECLQTIGGYDLKNYDCLVTDYSMSGMTGIKLLERIKSLDPTLEVIVVTGENERKIIQESLRCGAYDFLDKPLNLEKFYGSVERAVVATSIRRKRDATEASLLAARSTGLFNSIETHNWKTRFDLIYAPKHELGGDFIEVFETQAKKKYAVFGDVSGHDIQSALLSSHFLGTLEGRRSVEPSLNVHALLQDYNKLLIQRRENILKQNHLRLGSSLSVCSVELSHEEDSMIITNCGVPPLYIIHNDNAVSRIFPQTHPLGWFEDLEMTAQSVLTEDIRQLHGFTDGLMEHAMKHHWDILSLLYHLNSLNKSDQQAFLFSAGDDILLATMEFGSSSKSVSPIIFEEYQGDESSKIDRFQSIWTHSLNLVIPDGNRVHLDRFVLACREAVINAIKHGCCGDASKKASFLVKYESATQTLEAVVKDPGEGHDFDYSKRNQRLSELTPGNLGLVLISKLVDETILEDGGSTLRMKMKI